MDGFSVALGAATAGWAGRILWQVWRAQRWPAAPGQVVAVKFPERRGTKGRPYQTYEIRYRYSAAGGASFESRRVGFGVLHAATDLAPPIRPGEPLAVYYDPRDPSNAVLRRDVPVLEAACGLLGLGLVAAGVLGMM